MPNHVHGIIVINNDVRTETKTSPFVGAHASPLLPAQPPRGPAPRSLGKIVGSFKSAVTKRIGRELNATGIWQRNYYEHIIRDEKDLQNKTDYIESNPMLWDEDDENPINQ
jgi:putative transposase